MHPRARADFELSENDVLSETLVARIGGTGRGNKAILVKGGTGSLGTPKAMINHVVEQFTVQGADARALHADRA